MEQVVLVDENDQVTGSMEKMEAHRRGLLHRAFSVVIFNSKGQVLLQKRSKQKYHSGGLWTNTCCSHPQPGEKMESAIRRKLKQEMGFDVPTQFAYKFTYRAEFENKLIENELDHVYVGQFDGDPSVNPAEVSDWRFASLEELQADSKANPNNYTYWFRLILNHKQLAAP